MAVAATVAVTNVRRRFVVSGRVQGVYFRQSAKTEAVRLGLAGWARNLDDGTVEVVAEGDPAAVDALAAWLHRGPPRALVTRVVARDEAPEGADGFTVR